MRDPVRIGNCSGFYGDRIAAAREMVEGGVGAESIDVLCGDYLAELTMLILARDRARDASLGYARTVVRQLEECLGTALERGVRIVVNAELARARRLAAGLPAEDDQLAPPIDTRRSTAFSAQRRSLVLEGRRHRLNGRR